MSMEFLTRLYWACSEERGHNAAGLNLGELYQTIPEAGEADREFAERAGTPDSEAGGILFPSELWDAVSGVRTAYEMQGFVNGWRLCAMMYDELRGLPGVRTAKEAE